MPTRLLAIVGSVTPPGRLLNATRWLLDSTSAARKDVEVELINLADKKVAFADGRPVTQSVFFGTAFDEHSKDNNPPDSLAKFLFEPAAGTGEALLDLPAFLSDANFGKSHRATNDESCPAPHGPGEDTGG